MAGVAQWVEEQPAKQGVTGSIPGQRTCLGHGSGPLWGVRDRQLMFLSLSSFSLPFPLKIKKNKSLKRNALEQRPLKRRNYYLYITNNSKQYTSKSTMRQILALKPGLWF